MDPEIGTSGAAAPQGDAAALSGAGGAPAHLGWRNVREGPSTSGEKNVGKNSDVGNNSAKYFAIMSSGKLRCIIHRKVTNILKMDLDHLVDLEKC